MSSDTDFTYEQLEAAWKSVTEGEEQPPLFIYRDYVYSLNPDGTYTKTPLTCEDCL